MKTVAIASLALAALAATPAQAQGTIVWPAPPARQIAKPYYFPAGTPLPLRLRTQLSTKVNKPGDRFYLDVVEDLAYHGQVVIPAGSIAVGEVAAMQKNGHLGRKGKLNVHLLHIETPYGPVRLTGQANDEGTSGTITSLATMVFVSWLGYFVHGTSAQLQPDTLVQAYLAEDLRFAAPSQSLYASAAVARDGYGAAPVQTARR